MKKPRCIAIIPARSGSKRIPRKNIKELNGHPLIAYTIHSARESGVFDRIIVSTDSEEFASVAKAYGAEVPTLRPPEISGSSSPDIEWVVHMLTFLSEHGEQYDCFSILRPTSPLRTPITIRRAWETFLSDPSAHSLRAIEKCTQHPAKMWILEGTRMVPVMQNPDPSDTPWHSKQYPSLPEVHVQNASLEIAWTRIPLEGLGIAGNEILPFVSEGYEGYDLNNEEDWIVLEHLIQEGKVTLPEIHTVESDPTHPH